MAKKKINISVNTMMGSSDEGIAVERNHFISSKTQELNALNEAKQPHREDRHSFFLLESGTITLEIDFQSFIINAPSIVYMHPDQVHRIIEIENVTVSVLAIKNENLNPEYLRLMENLTPAKPMILERETFLIVAEAIFLCIKFAERKSDKLFHSLLKDSSNAFIALVISQYLKTVPSTAKHSRFKFIADTFKADLEANFICVKSPSAYAQKLNISTPYLNECVRNATGYPVSYHIRQRIILEAKRMLYHSAKSIKEISASLGYIDYPYFSKLFTKAVGITPLQFRNKNLK